MSEKIVEAAVLKARRIQEDALYYSKGNLEASMSGRRLNLWLGIPAALSAGLASVSAISEQVVLASVLAIVSTIGTTLLTFLSPKEAAAAHLAAANNFKDLFNRARILHTVEALRCSPDEFVVLLKELDKERGELIKSSPGVSRGDFDRGAKAIETGDADYLVDKPAATGP